MHDLSTDEKRRNFIADEIKKRLIGPGYTEDAFLCKPKIRNYHPIHD